jgi:hypothetical protein
MERVVWDITKQYDVMERRKKKSEPGRASEINKYVHAKRLYIRLTLNHFDGILSSTVFQSRHSPQCYIIRNITHNIFVTGLFWRR